MSGTLTVGKLILTESTYITNSFDNTDAFDRLRVSEPVTLFELNHTIGKMPILVDEIVSGSGSSTHKPANSYVEMKVTAGTEGKVIRQSFEYIPYQPGKSRLMLFSGVMEMQGGITGVTCRIGCFDSNVDKTAYSGSGNGCFFELNGTTMSVVIRLNNTDSEKVARGAWNYDKFDGNGPSGFTITDFSKAMIYAIDQEWLGVGRVRFGFFINGKFWLAHSFNHSGAESITVPYTKTAKLPIRYEISTTTFGGGGTDAEMRMICSTVLSEGGYEPAGITYSIGLNTSKTVSTTKVPIISIRLLNLVPGTSDPYNRKSVIMKGLSLLNTQNRGMQWDLYLLPDSTYINGSWNIIDANNSVVEYNTTATTVTTTGAYLLDSGYGDYSSSSTFNYDKYLASPLVNSKIDGTSRVLCLAGVRVGNQDVTVFGSMAWIEIL